MTHKLFISGALVTGLLCSCVQRGNVGGKPNFKYVIDTAKISLADLKKSKKEIDTLAVDTNKLIVMVKVPGKDTPVKILDDKYPDEVETTYNFLTSKNGQIIYAVEIPYSESGDWFIAYKSYFDKNGNLFAFVRNANFFNSDCTSEGGVAYEKLLRFYNGNNIADSTYTLTSQDNKSLIKSKCVFNYDYPYRVIMDVKSYLSNKHISRL